LYDVQHADSLLLKLSATMRPINWEFFSWVEKSKDIIQPNDTKITTLVMGNSIEKLNILLRTAAGNNAMEDVKNILSEVGSCSFKHHVLANTLPIAVAEGFVEIARLLLESGACVDERYNGMEFEESTAPTPLLLAVIYGHAKLVQILIENKADVNIKANLLLAKAPEFLHYSNIVPLHYAAADGDINTVKLLLENGAEIDIQNALGETPLSFAVQRGHNEVVGLLLKHDNPCPRS
jgi:ankyrin repeat protein